MRVQLAAPVMPELPALSEPAKPEYVQVKAGSEAPYVLEAATALTARTARLTVRLPLTKLIV